MIDVKDFIMNIFIIKSRGIYLCGSNVENTEIDISFADINVPFY